MSARWSRAVLVVCCMSLTACGAMLATPVDRSVVPLNVQVRNSGLPGGYVWLANPGEPSQARWHTFGQAEFICVTCAVPFVGTGYGYTVAVLDERCNLLDFTGIFGGDVLIEIEPGPTIRLVDAPPLGDWMPTDSTPAPMSEVPCPPPNPGQ